MSDEQKSDSGGSPPPPAPAPGAPGPWLPPRLRDRLAMADEPPPKAESPLMGIVVMVVIAAMVGGLVYWKMQSNAAAKKAEAARAEADRRAAVADSLDRLRIADSLKTAAQAAADAAFLKLPAWKQAQIRSGVSDTSAAGTAAAESGHFVIDAGSFLVEDPAQAAAAAIKSATHLAVRVVPVERDGNTTFHVYVGDFKVRGEATYTANVLFDKGTLPQANVVKLDE